MNNEPDKDLIDSFTSEEYSSLKRIFISFDGNKDGFLNKSEMLTIIQNLGFKEFTLENIDQFLYFLFAFSYTNLNVENLDDEKTINLTDYLKVMKEIKIREGSLQISQFIKDIEKILTKETNSKALENPEINAYIKIINDYLSDDNICKKYIPITLNSNEIFENIKDGIILCSLINKIKGGTIDERVMNKNENMSNFQKMQNLSLAISASKSIGIKCGDISSEIIFNNSDILKIINYLGEICKSLIFKNISLKNKPELKQLLNKNEQISSLLKLSPEDILLKWFNYHLEAAKYDKKIENFSDEKNAKYNFSEDIKNLEKYIILFNQINNDKILDINEADINKKAESIILVSKNRFISSDDLISGNVKLNILFIASIFNSNSGLKPIDEKQKKEILNLLADENSGEENINRNWINSLNIKNDKGEEIYINNLYEECKDGILLLRIIDKIEQKIVNWKRVDKKVKNVFNKLANCNEVINCYKELRKKLGDKKGDDIAGIAGSDIRDGNKKFILSLAWQLMKMHSLKIIGNKTEKELIDWGNEKVSEDLKIKSLKDKKIGNSLYFIEIIKSIDERAVNLDIVIKDKEDKESKENNAKNCISFARKLGAIVFLEYKDIVLIKSKLLLTFLASLYELNKNYIKKD